MAQLTSPLLLAGAWATEREPPAHAGWEPGWHQPRHVRDPAESRRRLAAQVGAGANAITAPTFRTARPTLARFGEARRAAEWTSLAVELARQAVELGLESSEREGRVLVCGSIAPLDGLLEEPDEEAFRVHAERIAEAGAEVLLVELMGSIAESRAATLAAAAVGLPVWSGALLGEQGTRLDSGESLAAWLESLSAALPERLIINCPAPAAALVALRELRQFTQLPIGLSVAGSVSEEQAEAALDAGASLLGLSTGATATALQPLRETLDRRLEARQAEERQARESRQAWLERAAGWAPGGEALWLGGEPDLELPSGFAWRVAPPADLARLPQERYRLLVVEPGGLAPVEPSRLAAALECGGILLAPADGGRTNDYLRVLELGDDPALVIMRRE